jgi:hypothetical protein
MDAIRDDGGTVIEPRGWDSADNFLSAVIEQAACLRLDRTAGQKTRLVVLCEAEGMAPQLGHTADPYGVHVRGGGGFDSTTFQHKFASELIDHDRPTEVLHVGDHDPSVFRGER